MTIKAETLISLGALFFASWQGVEYARLGENGDVIRLPYANIVTQTINGAQSGVMGFPVPAVAPAPPGAGRKPPPQYYRPFS